MLYDMVTILPLSLLLTMLFGGYAGVPDTSIWGCIISLCFTAGCILLRHISHKNRMRSLGIISVFLIGLCLAASEEARIRFLTEYLWVIWLGCFAVGALLTGILMDRNIWIRRAVAAAAAAWCITGTVLAWNIRKEVFALICLLLLVRIAEEIQGHWQKSGYPERKEHIARIAPLLLTACLVGYVLPAPDAPYDWKFVKELYSGSAVLLQKVWGTLLHPSDEYGTVGFSDSGEFLSGLSGNDEEILSIQVSRTSVQNLRLVGCISGDFQNRAWVFDTQDERDSRMMDTIESACAAKKFDDAARTDYLQKLDMRYENLFYNTHYIFSPAKIKMGATKEKFAGIREMNGSLLSRYALHYKDSYEISCYVLNYANPRLEELLTNAEPITETEWKQSAAAEKMSGQKGFSFADYQSYRREVYETYCHARGVSEQVREILNGIRQTSHSRYEAMKQLEAYLRKLEYATDCGVLPDSVTDAGSFLDEFLFRTRKGYCMHFATAFVLMANEMGVPCRYVQGYNVRRDANGQISVKQSSAHAWPEVYFDHVGWVAFEPTPGYEMLTGWQIREKDAQPYTEPEQPDSLPVTEPEDLPDEPEPVTAPFRPLLLLIPTLAVVVFLMMLYVINRLVSERNYRCMNCAGKFRFLTRRNLRFLGFLGFRMEENETLSEYAARILCSDREELRQHLGFIPIYETLLYSDREISEEDVRLAERTSAALRSLVKKSKLRYRLLFWR